MEDLAVLTALNRSGSFGKNSVKFQKINMLFAGWEVRMVKNCVSRPRSQFFTIRTSQPENNIYFLYFIQESQIV